MRLSTCMRGVMSFSFHACNRTQRTRKFQKITICLYNPSHTNPSLNEAGIRYARKTDLITIKRRTILSYMVIVLALAIATPALADYLGPNRTVTEWTGVCKIVLLECQYVSSKDVWRYRKVDDWSCSLESKPWNSYPSQPSSQGCFSATEGDQYWERNEVLQEVTTTYPPATITGALQNCTVQNGWCVTVPQLELAANEPLAGYNILAIEGTLNGQTFACPDSNCSVTPKSRRQRLCLLGVVVLGRQFDHGDSLGESGFGFTDRRTRHQRFKRDEWLVHLPGDGIRHWG